MVQWLRRSVANIGVDGSNHGEAIRFSTFRTILGKGLPILGEPP